MMPVSGRSMPLKIGPVNSTVAPVKNTVLAIPGLAGEPEPCTRECAIPIRVTRLSMNDVLACISTDVVFLYPPFPSLPPSPLPLPMLLSSVAPPLPPLPRSSSSVKCL
jgi:hypothetical protein